MPPGSRVFWRPCSLSWTCVLRPNRTSAESVCCRAPRPSCLPPARDQPKHPADMAWRRESPGWNVALLSAKNACFSGASRLCTCHASGRCDGQCPERICALHEYSAAPAHRASAAYSARCGTGGASGCSCPDAAAPFLPDGDSAHEQLLKLTDVYLRSRATPARCVPSVWSRYLFCHAMFKINMVTKWAAKAKSSLAGELYDLAWPNPCHDKGATISQAANVQSLTVDITREAGVIPADQWTHNKWLVMCGARLNHHASMPSRWQATCPKTSSVASTATIQHKHWDDWWKTAAASRSCCACFSVAHM